jgi:4-amino-4-deoxy-L-arabinose transferase-like glycosyltransferase
LAALTEFLVYPKEQAKPRSVFQLLMALPESSRMVLLAFAIRLAVIPFVYNEWLSPYFVTHWEQGNVARSLLAGHGFGSPFLAHQPSAILTPVYPLILTVIFAIFGIHTKASILAALGLNSLLSSLACIPVFLMARRSFGPRAARWAGWGWALSPYGIYFSAEWAWSTQVLLLCLCWLLYLSQDLERSPKLWLWAGFGVLSGVAAVTEPVVLTVVPFLMALAAWRLFRNRKRWLMPGLVGCIALAVTISPWTIRNYVVFHRFIPMRDSMGLELKLGNDGYSRHWIHADLHPNHDARELEEYNQSGELAYMAHKSQQATSYIREHKGWYAGMSVRRAIYLWTGYWSFSKDYLAEEPLDPPNVFLASLMTLLALLGILHAWRQYPSEAIRYAGVLLLFPAMYYFTHPQAYHMRPVDPVVLILACFALVQFAERNPRLEPPMEELMVDEEFSVSTLSDEVDEGVEVGA